LGGEVVVDTLGARYVWEVEYYPQYYVPLQDVRAGLLEDEDHHQQGRFGTYQRHGVRLGELHRPRAARVLVDSSVEGLGASVRFEWSAMDAWFEEDEQIFVHPRNPYVRVDALRSTREIEIALEGVVLARSRSPVLVFETGLPTRYYLDRTQIDLTHLEPSSTVTACPYKGTTSSYWSARIGDSLHADIAWSYDFPTQQLTAISGLVAFYNERVDISLDGVVLTRPETR
jgi:uncharacterized protein (DUF427 family)